MSELRELIDLASERLGGAVVHASDEFFGEKESLLRPGQPVFEEGAYTDRGKWVDGWLTRRRRGGGHDFCLVRLGLPGVVRGLLVDTTFFRGDFPSECSIDGCAARSDASPEELLDAAKTGWVELLPRSPLLGDSENLFEVRSHVRVTHLRFNVFPDGGVARLRVHGEALPDWKRLGRAGRELDLAALENGALALVCSDRFFGDRNNLLLPGRAAHAGEGWLTRRRRGPGHDWVVVRLAAEGEIRGLEIDTTHFKGDHPDTCSVEGIHLDGTAEGELLRDGAPWQEVLSRRPLQPHTRHLFDDELRSRGPFTHVRVRVFPDGGISRLRVVGVPTVRGVEHARVARLNALTSAEAERELLAACASAAWAREVAARRPFRDLPHLLEASDETWAGVGDDDVREALSGQPGLGERAARLSEEELEAAAEEQRKITRTRLEKMVRP